MRERKKGGKEFYRTKAKKMDKRVKSKIKKLEKIDYEGIEKPKEEKSIQFKIGHMIDHGKRILQAKEICKCVNDKDLIKDSSFYIKCGEKIGLIGKNGSGKTTLINCILRKDTLNSGEIWLSPTIKIGYLTQDGKELEQELTPLEYLDDTKGEGNTREHYDILIKIGFDTSMIKKKIKYLSWGECTRLRIAKLIAQKNNMLILDEPNCHLDLISREELEKVLVDYVGTILIVSHDNYMLEKVCDRFLIIKNSRITSNDKYNGENKEGDMLLENQLSAVLSKLSLSTPGSDEYKILEKEYVETLRKMKS